MKGLKDLGCGIAMSLNLVGQSLHLVFVFFLRSVLLFKSSLLFLKLVCFNVSGVVDEAVSSKGYVTFSLTNGPEYHISQVLFILTIKRCSLLSSLISFVV